jgi:hypothetical protein
VANSLTYDGEKACLLGGASDGSLARVAVKVRLYEKTSTPNKDGTGFVEVADGNGYTTGGKTISPSDWVYDPANSRIKLNDQVWTATGGSIEDIKGAYLVDSLGNVLAWWERATAVTLSSGDTLTLDDLTVELI